MVRPMIRSLFVVAVALLPTAAKAQGEARDLALEAFAIEFYRHKVSATPDALAQRFQEACEKGYNPACRRNTWFNGSEPNLTAAAEALLPSCESGDPVACIVTGWSYEAEAKEARTEAEAMRQIKRAARNYRLHCDESYAPACHDYARVIYEVPSLGADPRAAVKRWQDACIQGVPASCDTLAKLYITGGPAITPNTRSAKDYAKRACDAGFPEGCATLGSLEQASWDVATFDAFYGDLCDKGHQDSCWTLARTYFDGIYPEPTEGRVQDLFSKACDLGHARACYESGRSFGEGQNADDVKAAVYYRKACELGAAAGCDAYVDMILNGRADGSVKESPDAFDAACEERESKRACSVLGQALIVGVDVPRNAERGRELLHRACTDERSEPVACANLAVSYEEGLGGDRDRTEASQYYRWACAGGHAESCMRRGDLLQSDVGVRRDDHEALNMYERACAEGLAAACRKGAVIPHEGTYVTKDLERAAGLYAKACEMGDGSGCFGLGQVLEAGVGGTPDMQGARIAYEDALERGAVEAKSSLSRLLWNGYGGKKDKGRARKLASEACRNGDNPACQGPAAL